MLEEFIRLYKRRYQLQKIFLRIRGAKIGKRNTFHGWSVIVGDVRNLYIGDNNTFNEFVYLNLKSQVTIGNDNHFSVGSKIITARLNDDLTEHISYPIIIGNNCWFAVDSVVTISKNETIICDNVIVGGKSLVLNSINTPGKYLGII